EMNGPPMEAHLGRTVKEMIPGMYPIVGAFIQRALAGEPVLAEVEKPASEPNGGRTILLSYEPARDEAGEVVGVSVSLVDMTALRVAEKSRNEVEEHFRHLLDLNPQIPWILDAEGHALDVSHKPMDVRYRVKPEGGEWTWMHARGWPRCDADGKILYWYGILENEDTD